MIIIDEHGYKLGVDTCKWISCVAQYKLQHRLSDLLKYSQISKYSTKIDVILQQ